MANTPSTKNPMDQSTNPKQAISEAKDMLYEAARPITDKAREAASAAVEMGRDAASRVGHQVASEASTIARKADEAVSSVGSGVQSLAGTLREKLPQEGLMGKASSVVTDGLERSGRYVQEGGLSGMVKDMTNVVRHHPVPALCVAFGLGFLIARSTNRNNHA